MSRLDKLSKDALFSIAIMLDLPDLLRFCDSNERVDELICQRNEIWYNKLVNEFPNWKEFNIEKDMKGIYETLYGLKVVKDFLKDTTYMNYSLLELYNLKELDLSNNKLTEIPRELENLTNLLLLDLSDNKLKKIPKELGNLRKLKILILSINKLKEISEEIGNLTNLKQIYLHNNKLREIPKEIGNLTNLQRLTLDKKTKIPKKVREIKGLKIYK